jgi:hypothetical protein
MRKAILVQKGFWDLVTWGTRVMRVDGSKKSQGAKNAVGCVFVLAVRNGVEISGDVVLSPVLPRAFQICVNNSRRKRPSGSAKQADPGGLSGRFAEMGSSIAKAQFERQTQHQQTSKNRRPPLRGIALCASHSAAAVGVVVGARVSAFRSLCCHLHHFGRLFHALGAI